jgi:ribosomal protein S18 acetylase RimI-like enzyme
MTGGEAEASTAIRSARTDDDDFILGLAERFTAFELPQGRDRAVLNQAIGADIASHLRERPATSYFFIIEDAGARAGFIHLQLVDDFFGEGTICHVSDLAIQPAHEGRGLAGALLRHAEALAREHACARLTLSVFPGNTRARALYERHEFGLDLIRMGKPLQR